MDFEDAADDEKRLEAHERRILDLLRRCRREFWTHVDTSTDGCWLWAGRIHCAGYGVFQRERIAVLAHRAAWILTHGWIPSSDHVLHRCDNPPCVRPSHLFLGDQASNVADMVQKGRQSRGERHAATIAAAAAELRATNPRRYLEKFSKPGVSNANAKLTDEEVRLIRACEGSSLQVAPIFGVSAALVRSIRAGKAWRHVD